MNMETIRDKLPITHDIIRRKKDGKAVSIKFQVQPFLLQRHIAALRIVKMRPCLLFKSSFGPRFQFEARGLWPICIIKKTLTRDCFSAKV